MTLCRVGVVADVQYSDMVRTAVVWLWHAGLDSQARLLPSSGLHGHTCRILS